MFEDSNVRRAHSTQSMSSSEVTGADSTSLDGPRIPIQYEEASGQALDILIGATIDEKYLIEDTLGRGAMAVVYRGTQIATGRPVALKRLALHSTEGIMRFSREIRNHSQLNHPNIVEFLEFVGSKSGQFFLVMELAEGCGLEDLIRMDGKIAGPENIANIMFQLCDALIYAHRGNVVHRDLKSSNIILMPKAGTDDIIVKVLDFGIAKIAGEARITLSGRAVGSPLYMSPEQCRGKTPTTLSDIYSLGIIAYEMVTGQTPYNKGTIRDILAAHCSPFVRPTEIAEIEPRLPSVKILDQIISKCLEVDPSNRWQSAADLKEAFEFWYKSTRSAHPPDSLPGSILNKQKPVDELDPKNMPKKSLAELYDTEAKREADELRQTRLMIKRTKRKRRQRLATIALIVIGITVIVVVCLHAFSSHAT